MAAGLVMGLVLLAPLVAYGPSDNEEAGLGVFSSQIFYRALLDGRWPFWLNDLGFGTPMPIGQRLDFHPVFAAASLVSLWAALCAVWTVHVAVMVIYFLRLTAVSGIRPRLRMVLLGCYVFSMPSVCYFYQTDWVSVIVAWSLLPVVVFHLHRAVREPDREPAWLTTARLGLLLGLWIINTHPGYLASLVVVLAVYVLVLAPVRARVYGCLLGAAVLAAGIAAARMHFVLDEMRWFPGSLPRVTQDGYTFAQYVQAAFVPFTEVPRGLRGPFVGLVVGLAALGLAVRSGVERDRHARACGVAFAVALALGLAPVGTLAPLRVFSAVWLFRDAMVFFALLAGGIVLQRALDSPRVAWRALVWCGIAVQVVQQGAAVWPGYVRLAEHPGRLQFYRHQFSAVGLGGAIASRAATYGPRLYVSEEVRTRLRGTLSGEGLHFVTDLVFLGVNPINAWFKGVSMDRLYPSESLMTGLIGGQQEVIENDTLLDVLGVNLVMQAAGEGPTPAALVETDRVRTPDSEAFAGPAHDILLLANRDAWPRAVLMDARAPAASLPFRRGCPHRGALCRDYTAFAEARLPDPVRLTASDGRYTARFAASERARLLFLSVLFRPEWQATAAAGALRVVPIADAFIGVTVPPGVAEIDLRFEPRVRIALAWVSGGILVVLLVGVGLGDAGRAWRRWRGADSTMTAGTAVGHATS